MPAPHVYDYAIIRVVPNVEREEFINAGVILYCRRPWQRLRVIGQELSPAEWLAAAALVPVIRVAGDLAKMAGYPVGVLWRRKHRRATRS